MRLTGVEAVNGWLVEASGLSEALMTALFLENHGYSLRVVFTQVIDVNGRVLEQPRAVELTLDAVDMLSLHGGLTAQMIDHPELIDWGLSEVAHVGVTRLGSTVRLEASWEGERRLEVHCHEVSLTSDTDSRI